MENKNAEGLTFEDQDNFKFIPPEIVSKKVSSVRALLSSSKGQSKVFKNKLAKAAIEEINDLLELAEKYPHVLKRLEYYKSELFLREKNRREAHNVLHTDKKKRVEQRRISASTIAGIENGLSDKKISEDFVFFVKQFEIQEPLSRTWYHRLPLSLHAKYKTFFMGPTISLRRIHSTVINILTEKYGYKDAASCRRRLRTLGIKLR